MSCWGTSAGSERMDVLVLSSFKLFITTEGTKEGVGEGAKERIERV